MARPKRRDQLDGPTSSQNGSQNAILRHFILDRQSGLPLYLQIAHEVMYLIESGALKDGDAPPSLRRLSKQLSISFLTVDKAYKWLQSRGVLTTRRGVGWQVELIRDNSDDGTRDRMRMGKFIDTTLAAAVRQGFDPVALARAMVRHASALDRPAPRKLAFVACHSEFLDDYVAELSKELTEFNVEVRGMLTDVLEGIHKKDSPERDFLSQAEYVLTTFYHAGFVQNVVAPLDRRVIVLTLSLNKDALYQVVSLPRNLRLGAVLSPTDPAPTVVKSLEYCRDQAAGSIPYAIVTDPAAIKRLRAKTDRIAYTTPCHDRVRSILKKSDRGILLRFGPAEDDIRKMRALLSASPKELSAT